MGPRGRHEGAGPDDAPDGAAHAGEVLDTSPFGDDPETEPAGPPRHGPSRLTLVLGAGVVLVAGVILGIQAHKAFGGPAASSSASAAVRQGPGGSGGGFGNGQGFGNGRGGQEGQGTQGGQGDQNGQGARNGRSGPGGDFGGRGGFGGAAVGTVQRVEGTKVYVQTRDGSVITVNTGDDTTVRVSKKGKVADLEPGGTVVVQGEKAGDGSITATAISEGGGRG
ncbi:hypothetical protein AB0D67_08440 [Streptosporangium sp. NPDC048047]|uniref:hypothetical protein n=1 Tax=Streptosporangium sp. NPDC048047 TaxID=3155748 RepID=UPI0034285040